MVHGFGPKIMDGSITSTPQTPKSEHNLFVKSPSTSRTSSRIDEDNEIAAHYRNAEDDDLGRFEKVFPADAKIIQEYGATPATFLMDQGDGRCMLERAVSDGNPVGAAMMYRTMAGDPKLQDRAARELYKGLQNSLNQELYLASVNAVGGEELKNKLKNKVEALDLFNQWNAGPGLGGWNPKERAKILAKLKASPELRAAFDALNLVK